MSFSESRNKTVISRHQNSESPQAWTLFVQYFITLLRISLYPISFFGNSALLKFVGFLPNKDNEEFPVTVTVTLIPHRRYFIYHSILHEFRLIPQMSPVWQILRVRYFQFPYDYRSPQYNVDNWRIYIVYFISKRKSVDLSIQKLEELYFSPMLCRKAARLWNF